jgi:hypothetical protein
MVIDKEMELVGIGIDTKVINQYRKLLQVTAVIVVI